MLACPLAPQSSGVGDRLRGYLRRLDLTRHTFTGSLSKRCTVDMWIGEVEAR